MSSEQNPHEAFTLRGGNADAAVLIHGIGGSPAQYRKLSALLLKEGFDIAAPLLPGHGGSMGDFCRTPYGAWRDHVRASIDGFAGPYRRVCLVGHSLGGLLSLEYAANHTVSRLVLINTPLAVKTSRTQLSINLRIALAPAERDDELVSHYRQGTGIAPGARWYEYPMWFRQLSSLLRHMRGAGKLLRDVRADTLIVQSTLDETVRGKSMRLLEDGLINAKTETLWLKNSNHSYFPPEDEKAMQAAIIRFFKLQG